MKKPQQKTRARSPQLNAQDLAAVRGGDNGTIHVNVVGGIGTLDNGVINSHNWRGVARSGRIAAPGDSPISAALAATSRDLGAALRCTVPCCADDSLCEACYGQHLMSKGRQAGVIGQCWAERICRGDLRAQPAWPDTAKARTIARRLVQQLARDPRLLDGLVEACMAGAAAWLRSAGRIATEPD